MGGGRREQEQVSSCTRLHFAISGNVVWHSIQLSEFNFLYKKFSSTGHAPLSSVTHNPHIAHLILHTVTPNAPPPLEIYVQLLIVSICAHQSCRLDDVWLFTRVPFRIVSVCVSVSECVRVCVCVSVCTCVSVCPWASALSLYSILHVHLSTLLPQNASPKVNWKWGFLFPFFFFLHPFSLTLCFFPAHNLSIFLVFHQCSCSNLPSLLLKI